MHDLQDILEVDRNKLEVGMGSVGMGTGKCGNSIFLCILMEIVTIALNLGKTKVWKVFIWWWRCFLNVQVSVEPGITIGFLNRLLVAEGLTLGVVPEVSLMISTIVPTSSLVYHTASVTLILVAVSNDNNHFHHYSDFCNAGRPPDCGRSCPWRRSGVNQSQAWDVPPGLSRW